jgi:hypothetical protein
MRNRVHIELETLEKNSVGHMISKESCTRTAINYFYKRFAHNQPLFLIGKIGLNIRIFQTLGFSILKMSPLYGVACNVEINAAS